MYYVRQLRAEALVDFVVLVSRYFHQDKIFFLPMTPIGRQKKCDEEEEKRRKTQYCNLPFYLVIN
jgi:hypothetical protein